MTWHKQILVWLVALIILVLLLWLLSGMLLPFLAGLVLTYFLNPVVDALGRLGLSRGLATSVILVFAIFVISMALLVIVPMAVDQIIKLANELPALIRLLGERIDRLAPDWVKKIIADSGGPSDRSISDLAGKAASWMLALLSSLWSGGMALVNIMSLLIVTPIVAFYMLLDWENMIAKVDSLLPREHVETIRGLIREIDRALAGFIRGQGTVCLFVGIFYAIALSLAGLKFGIAIGILTGLLSFIPYFGAIFGGVSAIGVALVDFWPNVAHIALIAGIYVLGQFLESYVLSPKLVGETVGLHPVWMMFALFAAGYLFGFAGLLMAVPFAAALAVLIRFFLRRYLQSSLYDGHGKGSLTRSHER